MVATPTQKLTPQQQAALQAAQQQQALNQQFMKYSYRQWAPFNQQNGNAYGAAPLNFIAPTTPGAYAEKIRIFYNLNVNYTANGVSPYANLTKGGIYNLLQEIGITFGNKQVSLHPYFGKIFKMLGGKLKTPMGTVLGNSAAGIQAVLYTSPTVAAGNNAWLGYFDVPLNAIHKDSINGLLPIMGTGTTLQMAIATAFSSFVGKDPLINVLDTNGTAVVTGTISPIVIYRDFRSMAMPAALRADLTGLPTVQIIRLPEINPLTAGSTQFKKIDNPYPMAKIVSVIIDSNSPTTFCAASNITAYELDQAENSNTAFFKYDATTAPGGVNPLAAYYANFRDIYEQDLDEGVLAFDALSQNIPSTDLQTGVAYLNLTDKGFPAARMGFGVANVGATAGVTARVVSYAIILNNEGIKVSGQ
jgi:hypothetical protein